MTTGSGHIGQSCLIPITKSGEIFRYILEYNSLSLHLEKVQVQNIKLYHGSCKTICVFIHQRNRYQLEDQKTVELRILSKIATVCYIYLYAKLLDMYIFFIKSSQRPYEVSSILFLYMNTSGDL